jgi:8-oxo-dGTP pyrophosphatase MutT (NUDIX family)
MPKPWRRLGHRLIGDHRIFKVIEERFESPRNGHRMDAVVLEADDWVNVIAMTAARECVLVRQYRFGSDALSLEIPGGVIDPGESPLMAAERELREETGYAAERWTALGSIAPNPAFIRNRLFSFLAEGCTRAGAQEQDAGEDIEVVLVPESQLDGMLARGELDHALVWIALLKMSLHARGFDLA